MSFQLPILKSGRLYQLQLLHNMEPCFTRPIIAICLQQSCPFAMNAGVKVDERALVRGALLHDYYLYDWHDRGLHQTNWRSLLASPRHALDNARGDFPDLTPVIILHHMFPLVPRSSSCKEAWIVTTCDKALFNCRSSDRQSHTDGFRPTGSSTPEEIPGRPRRTRRGSATTWTTEISREYHDTRHCARFCTR